MAFALEKTETILNRDNISLAQYTHARKDIALQLLEQLKLLRFIGVSVSMKHRPDPVSYLFPSNDTRESPLSLSAKCPPYVDVSLVIQQRSFE